MADLFSVTAPLVFRDPDGTERLAAAVFPHPQGVLVFDLYWDAGNPADTTRVVRGKVQGEGPWKVDAVVIRLLGCQGTDADLARAWQDWQAHIQTSEEYPPAPLIEAIARRLGALTETAVPGGG